ncbi:uncharacterized protein LOC118746294 [Rhagoletis pomonella]|uniref:uncharacterized protein LOC118746294 n=1 Tax=Rhagoletis pomonella TaxID=28610 RepID=UPI001782092E|nr:uncharacterized protein LOC118746294 [Rhagoletis pomonella]
MPRKSKTDFNKNAKADRVIVKTSPVNAETNIIRRTLRSSNSNLQVRTRNQSRSEKNSPKPVTSSRTRSGNVMSSTVDEAEPSISRKTLAEDKENAELSDESPQKIPKNKPVPMDSNEIVSTKDTADEPMQVDMQSTNVGSKDCAEPQTDSSATKINLNNNKTNIEKKENEVTEEPTQTESPSKDNRNVQRSASIDKLTTLFSNLYLNSVQRLCLQFPPRCAEDLVYCRKQHFQQRFNEMDKPSEARLMQLRCTLKQQRYLSFINLAMDMCQRYEFPGEDTFTNLIELILSLNPKTGDAAFIRTYRQSIELFSYMVRTFPPCWRATHTAYIGFFQRPLDAEKIYNNKSKRDNRLSKSKKVFDIILDLTEIILNECTNEELSIVTEPQTPTNEKKAKEESVVTETRNSEPFDHHKWEERDSRLNTYTALKPTERLERLFIVLRLILQILESDFVMWLLHHYRKNKNWLFYTDSRPLAVFVLGISEEAHLSALGRQLFLLFAMAVNKGLNVNYLKVLERYIALLMVISNTADIEHTVLGVKYPQLGPNTKQIILDFFRKFKDRNLNSSICNYIKAIDVLRIPYVRYTFIDQFLQMFGFLYSENFSPEKVFHYMRKKRWLKQKKQAELHAEVDDSSDVVDEISCEQHLSLLLEALKAYCEWHASKDFMQIILNKRQVSCLKITTHSLHHTPIASGGLLNLARMENDIVHLEGKLRKTVRVAKPVIDLPLMDICIDQDLRFKYRNDLKYLNALQQKVTEQSIAHPEVDFSAWETFLIDFKVD